MPQTPNERLQKPLRVRICGYSRKLKNKIKEHGDVWEIEFAPLEGMYLLRTIKPVHSGKHPYEVWAVAGLDFDMLPGTPIESLASAHVSLPRELFEEIMVCLQRPKGFSLALSELVSQHRLGKI